MTARAPTPWHGEPWAAAYRFGMDLAVLYESKFQGEHHSVCPYLTAQDAWEGCEPDERWTAYS